ncbi:MAG: plasmid pRiA4b ORF-3 family protein [bacterium]
MKRVKSQQPAAMFQLKVTLHDSNPSIWRRLQIPGNVTLGKLHHAIQVLMDWKDYHLHLFDIDGQEYSDTRASDLDTKDEDAYTLGELVTKPKTKFFYAYDFGDSWEMSVVLEKILPFDAGNEKIRCTGGRLAGPPEDCGGIMGFYGMLEALSDPNADEVERDNYLEWLGGKFDPEAFSVEDINKKFDKWLNLPKTTKPARKKK